MFLFKDIYHALSMTFKLFTCYYGADFIQKYAKNKICAFIAVLYIRNEQDIQCNRHF